MPTDPMPRAPVLDWASFAPTGRGEQVSIEQAPHKLMVTSGRAALYLALQHLNLPPGTPVLVPTYHCPTMVAPVVVSGLQPRFYPLGHDGLPMLERIDLSDGARPGAIIVAHLFGLPRSLREVRQWCDRHGIALIEDCAHSYFGMAGERPVGHWGDLATASISKFLPVPEAGWLVSASRPLVATSLAPQSWRAQLKGLVDVLEVAAAHGRLRGFNSVLRALFRLKAAAQGRRSPMSGGGAEEPRLGTSQDELMTASDMGRVGMTPLAVSRWLTRFVPHARVCELRRRNYLAYSARLAQVRGVRPLFLSPPPGSAPYVFPLWVDDAERVYARARAAGLPVFRWDRIWPGTPETVGDAGPAWSRHVLQLLCHQDLRPQDVEYTATTLARHAATDAPAPAAPLVQQELQP